MSQDNSTDREILQGTSEGKERGDGTRERAFAGGSAAGTEGLAGKRNAADCWPRGAAWEDAPPAARSTGNEFGRAGQLAPGTAAVKHRLTLKSVSAGLRRFFRFTW